MMRVLSSIEPTTILDVGAGSGYFSRELLSHTSAREAWCVDTSYATDSDRHEAGKTIHFRRAVSAVDADLVLLMDVLEHVDDDVTLLKDYVAKVPRGSHFLVSVPAFGFLWSGHDVFLEHKRRYTLRQTESVIRSAGLNVMRSSYYFGAVFPIAAALRIARRRNDRSPPQSQLRRHHPIINAALRFLCELELPFMRWNRTAGLTVFCLAEKN
jgi:trans-aconitate methyltransferase